MVVLRVRLADQPNCVLHAGAPAFLDPDANSLRAFAVSDDVAYALGGLVGQADDGKASHVMLQIARVQGPRNVIVTLRW